MADIFDAGNGVAANFHDGRIEVKVNGTSKGQVSGLAGETIGAFLKRQAQTYGVRTFSAYADGVKLTTEQATKPLTGVKEISLVAKDARGVSIKEKRYTFTTALL